MKVLEGMQIFALASIKPSGELFPALSMDLIVREEQYSKKEDGEFEFQPHYETLSIISTIENAYTLRDRLLEAASKIEELFPRECAKFKIGDEVVTPSGDRGVVDQVIIGKEEKDFLYRVYYSEDRERDVLYGARLMKAHA